MTNCVFVIVACFYRNGILFSLQLLQFVFISASLEAASWVYCQIVQCEQGEGVELDSDQAAQLSFCPVCWRNVTAPPKAECWHSRLENLRRTMWALSLGFTQVHNGFFVCILVAYWDALYAMPTHWGLHEYPVMCAQAATTPAFPTWSTTVGWATYESALFGFYMDVLLWV